METDIIVVYCTVPKMEDARRIAQTIVNEKVAACCNIIPGVESYYIWKDEVQQDKELLLMIKTTENAFRELQNRIIELHPYDVPEIIALPVIKGNNDYLTWVEKNVHY